MMDESDGAIVQFPDGRAKHVVVFTQDRAMHEGPECGVVARPVLCRQRISDEEENTVKEKIRYVHQEGLQGYRYDWRNLAAELIGCIDSSGAHDLTLLKSQRSLRWQGQWKNGDVRYDYFSILYTFIGYKTMHEMVSVVADRLRKYRLRITEKFTAELDREFEIRAKLHVMELKYLKMGGNLPFTYGPVFQGTAGPQIQYKDEILCGCSQLRNGDRPHPPDSTPRFLLIPNRFVPYRARAWSGLNHTWPAQKNVIDHSVSIGEKCADRHIVARGHGLLSLQPMSLASLAPNAERPPNFSAREQMILKTCFVGTRW
jgi:hypothetical protein